VHCGIGNTPQHCNCHQQTYLSLSCNQQGGLQHHCPGIVLQHMLAVLPALSSSTAHRPCLVSPLLQAAPITNAGYGSNLTLQGSVECDAGIMAGDGSCGAVGAVPGAQQGEEQWGGDASWRC
jgi:hypothetical protein